MLESKITEDIKTAMKSGEKIKVLVLRMFVSELKNKKIADKVKELDDKEVIGVMRKMAKRYVDSIDQFKKAGREDLVEKETIEFKVLKEYLPVEMEEDELTRIVEDVIRELGASSSQDMGGVMKNVLERVGGRADGKMVSGIVKEKLS
ncbi:MAG: GatB/YqeY domain-containing protein [Candidatus Omnitrophica bacterium]|nr:GatB/YqeY domain-containing protein [Candidatus Omnitrophota bacterium]